MDIYDATQVPAGTQHHGEKAQPHRHYISRGTPEYRKLGIALFAVAFVNFTILYYVQPLMPLFSRSFHVSPAESSLSLSVSTLFLAVSLPFAGAISDAVGRKNVMVVALIGSTVICAATAVSPNFAVLLVLRALQGILIAGIPALAMAYLGEEIEPKSLGLAMGLYISGNSIGGMSGRIITGMVVDASTWRMAVWVLVFIALASTIAFIIMLPASRNFRPAPIRVRDLFRSLAQPFRSTTLVLLYAVGALLMGSFVALYNYIGFRLEGAPYHLPQWLIGWIFLVYLMGTFSSSFVGRLGDVWGRQRMLWMNVVLMGIGVAITLSDHLILIILGMCLFTFGFFGGHSTASSWVGSHKGVGKGQASSLYLLFYYVGSSVGGSVCGVFWSRGGWPGVAGAISAWLCAALVVSMMLRSRARGAA